ncbi:unnamed protein product [Orchesella dallaii]|uniref:Uncharacterized protein n=1 Tax=Orchesella dallaii TaxID=48710 RepID=A0ABP1QFB7_9HEXA
MSSEGFQFLATFSGIFRALTVICGLPAVVLAWTAYFSSSWTKAFPEIQAILDSENKAGVFSDFQRATDESTSNSTPSSDEDYDLISDADEEYLDKILLETLIYEKAFIGIVTFVFIISTLYLILRIANQVPSESPYEIIIDFLFHVISALLLFTGSALLFQSVLKIQSFVDRIDDNLPAEIVEIIEEKKNVQDKDDKIAAGVLGMINGVLYVCCVISLRMTRVLICRNPCRKNLQRKISISSEVYANEIPRFSVISIQSRKFSTISEGNPAYFLE